MSSLKLCKIANDGSVAHVGAQSQIVKDVCMATAKMYGISGFQEPWIGYLALIENQIVGTCSFRAPKDGRVEIAYFTFPGHEGAGIGTAMAKELTRIAFHEDASMKVFAQTLAEENASTIILKKLGFERTKELLHEDAGVVWEWELLNQKNI